MNKVVRQQLQYGLLQRHVGQTESARNLLTYLPKGVSTTAALQHCYVDWLQLTQATCLMSACTDKFN